MSRYGVIPSPKDERDFKLERIVPKAKKFPDEFQIEGTPINIYDQGNVGQCVAFSLREIREVLEKWSVSFVPPSPPQSAQYEIYFENKVQADNVAKLLNGNIKINQKT